MRTVSAAGPFFSVLLLVLSGGPHEAAAQSIAGSDPHPELHLYAAEDFGIDPKGVTFNDVLPILQRSCQSCHRPGGVAPMSLLTYEEVRPWAEVIKLKTAIRDRMGAMPPFYLEKDIGIQEFKYDPSLSDEELALVQAWVDNGAQRGDPREAPPPLVFDESNDWTIGTPDLVVRGPDFTMDAVAPDWWGNLGLVPTGLTEDRYVKAVEVREVNDIGATGETNTVGGRYIFHHQTYSIGVLNEGGDGLLPGSSASWPIHEIGRNADIFPDKAGRLLPANAAINLSAAHLHANGRQTTGHLEFGFVFHPPGYEPEYRGRGPLLGNGNDIDVPPGAANQEFHSFTVLDAHTKIIAFEPHLHAPGTRMCIEAIWGFNHFTLNCVGYDHNWVKQYVYEDHAAPLLPKGTILHIIGFLDTTDENSNLADNRNWAGGGRRSVSNMFIDLGYSVELSEEQFQAEMAERRARMGSRNEYDVGCPLCWAPPLPVAETAQREAPGASPTATQAATDGTVAGSARGGRQ